MSEIANIKWRQFIYQTLYRYEQWDVNSLDPWIKYRVQYYLYVKQIDIHMGEAGEQNI